MSRILAWLLCLTALVGFSLPQAARAQQASPAGPAVVPTANPDTYGVDEDDTLTKSAAEGVLANDVDLDGDPLSAELVSGTANGTLTLNADGSFTYAPDPDFNGVDAFDYRAVATIVEDLIGHVFPVHQDQSSIEVTVTVQLGGIQLTRSATSAISGSITADVDMEDSGGFQPQQIGVTDLQLTAVDGMSFELSLGALGSANVTIAPNDLMLLLDQAGAAADVGADGGFSQTGNTLNAQGNVTVVVTGIAEIDEIYDLSTFDAQPFSIAGTIQRDGPLLALTLPLGYTLSQQIPLTSTLTATVTITISPAESEVYTTHMFATETSDPATAAIDVAPVNDPPVAVNDEAATDEDTPADLNVLVNDSDVDGDPLSIGSVSEPANGTAEIVDGPEGDLVRYTPAPDFFGTDTFTYTAVDGQGGTDEAEVTVDVVPVDDPPVAEDDAYNAVEGATLTVEAPGVLANDTDAEGDPMTAVLVDGPSNGTLTLGADGSFSYTPGTGFLGQDTFTYRADDGLASNVATVTIDVAGADVEVTKIALQGSLADVLPLIVGTDNMLGSTPSVGAGAVFAYLIRIQNNGPNPANVTVTDDIPAGLTDVQVYTAGTVDCSLVGTSLTCTRAALAPGTSDFIAIEATAPDAADESVSNTAAATTDPLDPATDDNTSTAEFVTVANPDGDGISSDEEDAVGDGNGDGVPDSEQPNVTSLVIGADEGNLVTMTIEVPEDFQLLGINVLDLDDLARQILQDLLDALPTSAAAKQYLAGATPRNLPTNVGARRRRDGSSVMPGKNTGAQDAFRITFRIVLPQDSTANSFWLYGPTPEQPTPHWFEFLYDGETGAEFETRPDGRPILYLHFVDGQRGDRDLRENDYVSGFGVPVLVTGNASPVTADDVAETDEDTAVEIDVLANDSDPDGSNIAVSTVGAPAHGTAEKVGGTMIRYTPAADFNGTDSFTYTATDGRGGTAQGTVTVTVAAVNDAPTAAEITSPDEGATVLIAGAPETAFAVTWDEAADVDGDVVGYTWELATEPTFADPLLRVATGELTRFETDYGTVAALLADNGVETGASADLYHRVVASDGQASTASPALRVTLTRGTLTASETADLPTDYVLEQNYPNPFNPATTIRFALPQSGFVRLAVYDLVGHEVATLVADDMPAGFHETTWDATGLASGLYVYRLEVAGQVRTMKMTLLK